MKIFLNITLTVTLLAFSFTNCVAQTTNKKQTTKHSVKPKTTTTPKQSSLNAIGKEVTVTLKNLSEGTISIFAGPKEELKNIIKKRTVGGLSTNKLYLRVNEVVCILNGEKTVSCASIKANTTLLEINSSGNGITGK